MRRARLIPPAFVFALFVAAAAPARAQWVVSADLGGAHLRQTGIQESNAATLGADADWRADRGSFHTSFLGARAASDGWTGQGLLIGSLLGPLSSSASWELLPVAGFFAETNGRPTWSDELIGRIRLGTGAHGFAVGAGGGTTSLGADTHALFLGEVDGWRIVGPDRFTVGASYVDTRSTLFRQLTPLPVRYGDLTAGWQHDAASWAVGVSGGVRRGWAGAPNRDEWGSLEATAWVGEHAALVAGTGRTLEDVTRGVPRTTYVSLALRISSGVHERVGSASRVAGPQLMVVGSPNAPRTIVVTARDASTVELMGDFTDWQSVALARGEHGTWRLERELSPGLHRVAIRIDGGAWTVPANLPRASDDLGGEVGLMTVP